MNLKVVFLGTSPSAGPSAFQEIVPTNCVLFVDCLSVLNRKVERIGDFAANKEVGFNSLDDDGLDVGICMDTIHMLVKTLEKEVKLYDECSKQLGRM